MRIESISWDDGTIAHIARHSVEPAEVEEALFERAPHVFKTKNNRHIALGQAGNGRYLTVILEYIGEHRAKVITGRAMSEAERKLYRRR